MAEQIRDYFHGIPARSAVNMPALAPELLARLQPYMTLMEKIGRFQGQLNDGAVQSVEVEYSGDIIDENTSPLIPALLQGIFYPHLGAHHQFRQRALRGGTARRGNQRSEELHAAVRVCQPDYRARAHGNRQSPDLRHVVRAPTIRASPAWMTSGSRWRRMACSSSPTTSTSRASSAR